MKILFLAFFFLFFIVVILGSILRKFVGFFVHRGRNQHSANSGGHNNSKENLNPNETQKQFSDDVGEYVSYEEIKEE